MKFLGRFMGRILFVLSFFFAFSLTLSAVEVTAPVYDKNGYVYEDSETGASASREVTVVVTSISGSTACISLNRDTSSPPYFAPTDSVTYTATIDPPDGPYDDILWGVEGDSSSDTAVGTLSFTTQFYDLGPKIIHVTLGESSQQWTTYVYRPDIIVAPVGYTMDEVTEEDTGAFVGTAGGEGQPVQIAFMGSCLYAQFYLNYTDADSHNHLEINDGSGWVNFNTEHTYTYNGGNPPIAAVPRIRGTTVSDSLKDITLTLTTSRGSAEDRVKVTVFGLDVVLDDANETNEEAPGVYIRKGEVKPGRIVTKWVPVGTLMKLAWSWESPIRLLYDNDGIDTPYIPTTYTYTYEPGCLEDFFVKGVAASGSCRDASINLITLTPYYLYGGGSDTVNVTVFDLDLEWDGLDEATEKETGLYIPLNVDDDNNDTTLDKDENPVYQENDLKGLCILKSTPPNLPGYLHLSVVSGSDKIKLWEATSGDTQKFVEVTSKDYNISDQLQDDTWLMVEGYDISSPKEVIIQLSYTPPLDQNTYSDTITATVTIGSVLIDPGHGGTASGGVCENGNKLEEKVPNLDIGQKLYLLLANAMDVDHAYITRSDDSTVSPSQRVQDTIELNPTLFFSIHNNVAVYPPPNDKIQNPTVRGTETYVPYSDVFTIENTFAAEIQAKVHGVVLENDRHVKNPQGNQWGSGYLYVLDHANNANHNGNLAEVTFISSPASEVRLRDDGFKESVAEAMKKALLKILVEGISYQP